MTFGTTLVQRRVSWNSVIILSPRSKSFFTHNYVDQKWGNRMQVIKDTHASVSITASNFADKKFPSK